MRLCGAADLVTMLAGSEFGFSAPKRNSQSGAAASL